MSKGIARRLTRLEQRMGSQSGRAGWCQPCGGDVPPPQIVEVRQSELAAFEAADEADAAAWDRAGWPSQCRRCGRRHIRVVIVEMPDKLEWDMSNYDTAPPL